MDYYNNSSHDNDDSDNSSEFARVNRVMLSKSSDEYRLRRERNNAAVKKSRFKSKQKTLETQRRVDQLRDENGELERKVESLSRELNFMRAIFVPRRDAQQSQQSQSPSTQTLPSQQQLQMQFQQQQQPHHHFHQEDQEQMNPSSLVERQQILGAQQDENKNTRRKSPSVAGHK